jgi:hypothetical protein
VNRVFHLTQNETPAQIRELATTIRAVGGIDQVLADDTQRTVTVQGTAVQVATAAWLVQELDGPLPGSAPQQYVPAGTSDVVRVFFTHAATPQSLQEIVTTIRSVADVRFMFTYNARAAATMRGTADQMAMADWLMQKLDTPGQGSAPQEFHLAGVNEVARVFYLVHPQTPQQVQEIVTLIRSIADIQRLFIYNAPKALALRSTADRIALAAWLVQELDQAGADSTQHEYLLPSGSDNVVRLFYVTPAQTSQQLQQIATQIRSTTGIPRMFINNALSAVAVRGTVGQIATTERVLEEMGKSAR